ncbi:MAG: pyruvate, phosphate dikinase [Candidatus Eisenbacteria bacterium]|nr:pyruvate, phosphate dikinase [Candidatus Eisenbacteria bacterium]
MSGKYVYFFGDGQAEGDARMRDVLGGKGAGLAEMTNAGVPVPPGFTITTEVCRWHTAHERQLPPGFEEQQGAAMARLETAMGRRLGDVDDPLLVSVRSGAKFSMPGMMDTILNLGLNDRAVEGLARRSGNPRFAWDCYRRFIQMFGSVVMGLEKREFEAKIESLKHRRRVKSDAELSARDLQGLAASFQAHVKARTGRDFPQEPHVQLDMARDAVFRSWMNDRAIYYRRQNGIPDDLGTAVNVQAMVFGNLGGNSGTGVGFTRNPATGDNHFYGEFLLDAQGEDVVAGVRTPEPIAALEQKMPEVYAQLRDITSKLEHHYRDVQDFEFTIQDGRLYLLQTRNGKRTGPAAVKIAVDMVEEGLISIEEAVMRVEPMMLDQLLHPRFDPKAKLDVIAQGLAASPGAGVGRVVFDAETAVERRKKKEKVILVRKETTPDDIHGMDAAQGILTATGGMTCLAGETNVLTDRGFETAEQLFERLEQGASARILSFDSRSLEPVWRSIVAAGCRQSDVITVAVSQTGRAAHNTIRLTADHKMMILSDRKLAKRPLRDCLRDREFALVLDRVPALDPIECSAELAYVAGAVFSDGHVMVKPTKGAVVFTQKPTPEKLQFIAAVETRFEQALGAPLPFCRSRTTVASLRGRLIRGEVEDRICARRGPAAKLQGIRKNLAQWVLGLERDQLVEFIAGYVDGDGTASENSGTVRLQVVVARKNRDLLEGLVLACLRLAIVPQVSVNRDAYLVQIAEQVEWILSRARRIRATASERRYDSKCFAMRGLFADVVEQVNYMGRVREAQKRNIMFGASKIRRDVLPLCRGALREEVQAVLDSPLRSYRIDPCHGAQPAMVYNFEVESEHELDKNFVAFTSHYTPVLVSNSHAAVVARGMGKPCVSGVSAMKVDERTRRFTAGGVTVREGDWISIDGSTGQVIRGEVRTIPPEVSGDFETFMKWTDMLRRLHVRANADIPRDAKQARAFVAEGIGLCRTEHMFFAEDRLPHVVQMIMSAPRYKTLAAQLEAKEKQLADADPATAKALKQEVADLRRKLAGPHREYRQALARLLPLQRADFKGLFQAMDGFPVTIRTLDPPLHEFLPKREELMVDIVKLPRATAAAKKEMAKTYRLTVAQLRKGMPELLRQVEELHEFNPMMGHRGCRLGITYPEVTEMQARAIFEAACDVAKQGGKVIPEVMIPLVGHVNELKDQAAVVRRVADEVMAKRGVRVDYLVGTMIEVPRAAVTADKVAEVAEFFSFGTNDLTQLAFGYSRDDAGKFLREYVDRGILPFDPFVHIDPEGVGELVKWAVQRGRATRSDLHVGICGEHGGDPQSVEFCHGAGLDYVSCSPFRVPLARLAAAQAAVRGRVQGSDQR